MTVKTETNEEGEEFTTLLDSEENVVAWQWGEATVEDFPEAQ